MSHLLTTARLRFTGQAARQPEMLWMMMMILSLIFRGRNIDCRCDQLARRLGRAVPRFL